MKLLVQIFYVSVFLLITSSNVFSSMRKCMLLPIKDGVGGSIGFKVYEQVEEYLLDSDWCYYRSNSEILNILGNYKKNLDEHLNNSEILKLIGRRSKAGSIIRIHIINNVEGVELKIRIIGGNGEDVLFLESTKLSSDDPSVISSAIVNWLNIYEQKIPYDGLVTGVLGNQFTADIGLGFGVSPGQDVEIFRAINKKKHPLFKEIVAFNTEMVGKGKISHVTNAISNGKIFKYESLRRLKIGDWVILKEKSKNIENMMDSKLKKKSVKDFGKLGQMGFFVNIGSGSDSFTDDSSNVTKIGGIIYGAQIWGELWATRNLWASLEISKSFGSYKEKEGTVLTESNSISTGRINLKLGYRYLPLGFFYGPRIDGYLGYAKYDYSLDNQLRDGFTAVNFSGLLLGTKGSVPIKRGIRVHVIFDFLFSSTFEEDVFLYGEDDSSSNYHLEVGGSYQYSPKMELEGGIGYVSSKAKFINPQRTLSLSDKVLKFGLKVNF